MRYALALTVLLVAACGREVKAPPPPTMVRVEVEVPVSLCPGGGGECELLRDCYNERPNEQTHAEAKRLAILRDVSIEEDCNKRWARVRAAQPARGPTVERKEK